MLQNFEVDSALGFMNLFSRSGVLTTRQPLNASALTPWRTTLFYSIYAIDSLLAFAIFDSKASHDSLAAPALRQLRSLLEIRAEGEPATDPLKAPSFFSARFPRLRVENPQNLAFLPRFSRHQLLDLLNALSTFDAAPQKKGRYQSESTAKDGALFLGFFGDRLSVFLSQKEKTSPFSAYTSYKKSGYLLI